MGLLDSPRAIVALERIAAALEVLARLTPIQTDKDSSAVFYVDDAKDVALEERQEAYFGRTGRRLAMGEEPPSHAGIYDETS